MNRVTTIAAVGALALVGISSAEAVITIQTVGIGNVGNAPDDTGYGSVGYSYRMGTFEVTASQYTGFLNAVAKADPYELYVTNMAANAEGCKIQRAGVAGSYTYSVPAGYEDRPVNYISLARAMRFANWMHNGQPVGILNTTDPTQNFGLTENGSYLLNGANTGATLSGVVRNLNATWVVPTEDEWYKAAYHKNDGVTGNYWEYATGYDAVPGKLLADPAGNNANFGPNPATPIDGIYWMTTVGEFQNSVSGYGTFDQSGNAREWTEAKAATGTNRIIRGGDYNASAATMAAAFRAGTTTTGTSQSYIGFRLGLVPAPSSMVLLAFGGLAMARRRR